MQGRIVFATGNAGKIKEAKPSQPEIGKIFSQTEKVRINRTPSQNGGIDQSTMVMTVSDLSAALFFLTAANKPSGIAIMYSIRSAAPVSISV